MDALKVHLKIESDTIKIPELSRFIGKSVEIILLEDDNIPLDLKDRLEKLRNLKGSIDLDADAVTSLREISSI